MCIDINIDRANVLESPNYTYESIDDAPFCPFSPQILEIQETYFVPNYFIFITQIESGLMHKRLSQLQGNNL